MSLLSWIKWYAACGRCVDYDGQTKFGVPHGKGKLRTSNASKFHFVEYEGDFSDGLFHGHGRMQYSDWDDDQEFVGEFVQGQRGSTGLLTKKNGETYEGAFENGWPSGLGIATWPDGRVFAGEFRGSGHPWEGYWKWPGDTSRRGRITKLCHYQCAGPGPHPNPWQFSLELEDAIEFKGGYSNGWPQGRGIWTFGDGTQFEGKFSGGLSEELGTWKLPNGSTIEGEFSLRIRPTVDS